jgi:hypothetical protein
VLMRDRQLDEVVGDAQIAVPVHGDVGVLGGEVRTRTLEEGKAGVRWRLQLYK